MAGYRKVDGRWMVVGARDELKVGANRVTMKDGTSKVEYLVAVDQRGGFAFGTVASREQAQGMKHDDPDTRACGCGIIHRPDDLEGCAERKALRASNKMRWAVACFAFGARRLLGLTDEARSELNNRGGSRRGPTWDGMDDHARADRRAG